MSDSEGTGAPPAGGQPPRLELPQRPGTGDAMGWAFVVLLYVLAVLAAGPALIAATVGTAALFFSALPLLLLAAAVILHLGKRRAAGQGWSIAATGVAVVIGAGVVLYAVALGIIVSEGAGLFHAPFAEEIGAPEEVFGGGDIANVELKRIGATSTQWFVLDAKGQGTLKGFTTGAGSFGRPGGDGYLGGIEVAIFDDSTGIREKRSVDVAFDANTMLTIDGKPAGKIAELYKDDGDDSAVMGKIDSRVLTIRFQRQGTKLLALSIDAPSNIDPDAIEGQGP